MSNSKKRTIGLLSVLVLLCLCLFCITITDNNKKQVHASTAGVDLAQTTNYTFGDSVAITSIEGNTAALTGTAAFDATLADPTATEDGLVFAIPQGYKIYKPIKFAQPITVDDTMDKLTLSLNCDLSSMDNSYGHVYGYPQNKWSVGIFIYPLDATGAVGEGYRIPFVVTQRQDIQLSITGDTFNDFVNDNGQIEGFIVASAIGGSRSQGHGSSENKDGAKITISSIAVEASALTASDFVDGKATLFTGKHDYTSDEYDSSEVFPTTVNGATTATYSTWGVSLKNYSAKNIVAYDLATDGAYYSYADMKDASNDGYGLVADFNSWGLTTFRYVELANKVKASDIGSLTFRVYANLDSTTDNERGYCNYGKTQMKFANDPGSVGSPYSGIYLYGKNADYSQGSGVLVNPFVAQREWTEITLTGSDLLELADADGYISGFRFGSAIVRGDDSQFYGGAGSNQYDKSACIVIDEIAANAPMTVSEDDNAIVLTDANADYSTDTLAKRVEGGFGSALNTAWGGGANGFSSHLKEYDDLYDLTASTDGALYDLNAVKTGAADGHALALSLHEWGYTISDTLYFNKAIKASDVECLSFRIYANISSADTYGKPNSNGKLCNSSSMQDTAGIYVYSTDKEAMGEGYLLKLDVTQREWIDLSFTGSDLEKLADGNGMISGFRIGSGLVINQDGAGDYAYMYKANATYDLGNALFIDSVTAYTSHAESGWITDTEPTCSTTGTKHTECTICGTQVQTGTVEIDANAHSFGAWVEEVPAKVGVAGVKAYKQCTLCEKYFDANGVEITDLATDPLKGVKYMSISTAGDIGVNFYVYLGTGVDSATATFTFDGVTSSAVAGVYDSATECFKFTYGVAPKDYKKAVTINVEDFDVTADYSVYQYSQDIDSANPAKTLVEKLIVYCEAARVYFAGETADLAADLTANLDSYAATVSGEDAAITLKGATLVVESLTTINVYFESTDISGIEFSVNGSAVTPIVVEGADNLYVISIENIAVKDLDVTYQVAVGGITVTYSALSYVEAILALNLNNNALNNVVKAIYDVSVAAEAYFA